MLVRLARACLRHRWIVIGAWVAALVIINGLASSVGPDWKTEFVLPSGEARDVQDRLEADLPDRAAFSGSIVIKAEQGIDDPEVQERFEQLMALAAETEGITVTSPYDEPNQISQDRTIAFAQLDVADRPFEELVDDGKEIRDAGDELPPIEGAQIEYGGDLFSEFELPESEVYGVLAAVVILIIAFGSVLAMGLPIGTALLGLGISTAARHPAQQRHRHPRLHDGDGGDDRHRRGHRLRPVHRHALSRGVTRRAFRRGLGS